MNDKKNEIGKEEFVEDSRFAPLRKDAVIVAVGWCIFFVLMMGAAYILGNGDPKEYTYLLGFPLWFIVCTAIQLIFMGICIYMLAKKFADVSLDSDDPEYDYKEGKRK